MKYTLQENLSDRKGVISNSYGFMDRNLDTGFKTKWSGYWSPSNKFLDYYGIKINGVWLDNDTLDATEYGDFFSFHHVTDTLNIEEKVTTPDGFPGFKISLKISNKTGEKKAVQTLLEPGIDIRSKDKDVELQNYSIDVGKNGLSISKNDRRFEISAENDFELKNDAYTRTHFPGGEKQVCFIPGNIVFRTEISPDSSKTIELEFRTLDKEPEPIESMDQKLEGRFGRTFNASVDSLENLVYSKDETGVIAGHPWFQNYWARDSFWTVLGLIDAGYFELSESILEAFVDNGLPGKINPEGDTESGFRSDTAPLYVIASEKLRKHYRLTEKLENGREKSMEKLELDGNIVNHDPSGTWMDTVERGPAIDIQSLWLEAARIMDDKRVGKLEKGLEEFKDKEVLKDELGDCSEAVNPVIPLMFEQVDKETAEKQLEKINGEFSCRYGARTRSAMDPGYRSDGYHTGSTWGLTTCWAAAANISYGNHRHGVGFLEKLEQFLDRDQPGALPEVMNSENGDLLGCPEQAWSAGMFTHILDSYILGIDVGEDEVSIDPVPGLNIVRKGKRVGEEKIDLRVEDGTVEVLNDPDLELRL